METIDKAGRIVICQELRAQVGLVPGEVRVSVLGAGILVEPVPSDVLVGRRWLPGHPVPGGSLTDDDVRALRLCRPALILLDTSAAIRTSCCRIIGLHWW